MKKSFWGIAAAIVMLFAGSDLHAQYTVEPSTSRVIADKILMYIPNRLADLADIISIDLEAGTAAKFGINLTHAFGVGAGYGNTGKISWNYGRKYGTGISTVSQAWFLAAAKGTLMQDCIYGNLNEYDFSYSGFRAPWDPAFVKKYQDYWALDVTGVLLAGGRIAIHPVELADFICGLFCIDISGDDYTLLIP